jgi:hypothetical protein
MLTTAAILMSLGTEPVNSHHVSAEQIDTGSGSFAKSFDEGVALAGEPETQIVDGKASKNTGDAKSMIVEQNSNVFGVARTGAKANVDARIQSELGETASLLVGTGVDKAATALDGAKAAATKAVELSQGEVAKESASHVAADVRLDMPSDELSVGSVQDTSQKLPPGEVDPSKTDVAEGIVVPPMVVAVSTTLLFPSNSQTTAVLNQKETEIAEKTSAVPVKKTAKNPDGVGKTTKPAKAEKNDKAAGTAGNTVGIEAQIQLMISVPGIVSSMEGQSSKASTTQEDVGLSLSAPSSTTTGQSNGLSATLGKTDKASMGMSKINPTSVRGTDAAATSDPASLKPEPDTAKTATQPATSETGGSAKGQDGIAAVLAPALTRAESGIAGVVSGVVVGAPAHIVSPRSQPENLNSSAGSIQAGTGMLVGSGTVDSGGLIDATHKTLTASPTVLEVGVPNGTHGWLKIRAEMTGAGGVNASLSTASTSGQEMLHRELPSLTAYLDSERVAVKTVVIQPAVTAGADFRGLAGGMNGDGRGQAQQSGGQGGENRQDTTSAARTRAEDIRAYVGANGLGGDDLLLPTSYTGGGSWLSVRA